MAIKTEKPDLESFVRKSDHKIDDVIEQVKRDMGPEKTFLLRLPRELWYELKMEALKEGKTLHEYMLQVLRNRQG